MRNIPTYMFNFQILNTKQFQLLWTILISGVFYYIVMRVFNIDFVKIKINKLLIKQAYAIITYYKHR